MSNVAGQHSEVRIRQAVEADREILVELFVLAYEDVRAQQVGDMLERIWDEWKADLPHMIDIKKVIIAEVAGRAVGFATYQLNDAARIGTVDDNAVLQDYRGCGIGTRLLACVLKHFKDAGMEFAQVSTGLDELYAPARRMYERQGFTPLNRSVTYFRELGQSAP